MLEIVGINKQEKIVEIIKSDKTDIINYLRLLINEKEPNESNCTDALESISCFCASLEKFDLVVLLLHIGDDYEKSVLWELQLMLHSGNRSKNIMLLQSTNVYPGEKHRVCIGKASDFISFLDEIKGCIDYKNNNFVYIGKYEEIKNINHMYLKNISDYFNN